MMQRNAMKKISPPPVIKPLKMFSLKQVATRPKSLDVLSMPSRMGGKLFYPKGD
jgi:hypothetical protein